MTRKEGDDNRGRKKVHTRVCTGKANSDRYLLHKLGKNWGHKVL